MFDQQTYEVRIDAEADLMIALEALKNEVKELRSSLLSLDAAIYHNSNELSANIVGLTENNSVIYENSAGIDGTIERVHRMQDDCRQNDWAIHENRMTLTLYCQQFAFSHEMVYACANLLSCRDR